MDNKIRYYPTGQEAAKQFGTDIHKGLTAEQVLKNREKYGKNEITPAEKDPLWKMYLEKFKDPTIIILCICAALSVAIGFYHKEIPWDGVGIFAAIAIATGVGFWSEYKADKAFETLKADSENIQVKVLRDGNLHVVSTKELVVGDIINIENGDKIPADAILLRAEDLQVDESLMTGESEPVTKTENDTKLLAGTVVVSGTGTAVVTKVGDKMEMGEILRALSNSEQEPTPLQIKLGDLAELISKVGTTAAAVIFFALYYSSILQGDFGTIPDNLFIFVTGGFVLTLICIFARIFTENKFISKFLGIGVPLLYALFLLFVTFFIIVPAKMSGLPMDDVSQFYAKSIKEILDYFIIAVTIIVVAVPEGLPMAVTISLALSMRKIRQDNNLVRKMLATETIGSVNVICSDKTGTLTKNQMEVREIYYAGKTFKPENFDDFAKTDDFELFKVLLATNSTANIIEEDGELKVIGNSTEGAILKFLLKMNVNFLEIREKVPVYDRVPFNSERKYMASTTSFESCDTCAIFQSEKVCNVKDKCLVQFVKGAPEKILAASKYIYKDGKMDDFKKYKAEIENYIGELSDKAMRVIGFGFKVEPANKHEKGREVMEDLVFLGLVAISDPIREDVPLAIKTAKEAGIDVKMVTGDNPKTAAAIAKELGLLEESGIVLEGSEFRQKSDKELLEIIDKMKVLARATPSDKERLVSLIQSKGLVVAVTGDGTNDAPALKKADVGLSMGLRGTDVAKEASDIVLTDDNFGSIVKAVKWGRTLYENVQKFLQFQLTINFSALLIAFLSPLLKTFFPNSGFQNIPLTVLQLLWINLVMDTLAALALGLEPPRDDIMKDKPKSKNESFLTGTMFYNIITMGICFTIFMMCLQAFNIFGANSPLEISSVIFTTYIFIQVFNLFNARAVKPNVSIFKNLIQSRSFLGILTIIVVVQIILTTFGGEFFRTTPLSLEMWGKIILTGICVLLLGAFFRAIRRPFVTK